MHDDDDDNFITLRLVIRTDESSGDFGDGVGDDGGDGVVIITMMLMVIFIMFSI